MNLFNIWDKNDPVDDWECKRAILIESFQKNVNYVLKSRCKNYKSNKLKNINNIKEKQPIKKDVSTSKENNNDNLKTIESLKGSFIGSANNHSFK